MSAPPGVLDGIKVVEFAQNAAIPHCGRLLAGLGADVVKVEPPTGDAMRLVAPLEGEGRAYVLINPGKRSIALDLTSPDAPKVVDALFAWADVVLVAFKLPDLDAIEHTGRRAHCFAISLLAVAACSERLERWGN